MNKSASRTAQQATKPLSPAQGILQRKCDCGNHTVAGGECAECSKKKMQRKLTIGASNDPLEQEADRVADQVLAASAHSAVSGAPPRILRFVGQSTGQADAAPASVDRVLASPGRPLDPPLQQDMEQRFGHDFSRVRVHSGAAAEQSARDVSANAYTVGRNIVFGVSRFAPGTHEGRRLIAHELTHVVQQSGSDGIRVGQGNKKRGLYPTVPDADHAALALSEGNSIGRLQEAALSGTLQREEAAEIQAPDLEQVPEAVPGRLPVASADPSNNRDFIDRRITAVGVGLSGTDFILFCEGIDNPIALPIDYIDLGNTKSVPVDHFIYPEREEALTHVPFGPPAPGASSQFAYYRAIGGLVVPTMLSAASAPETVKLINGAEEKLRGFVKEVTDTLVIAVLLFITGALVQKGISKWINKRGAPSPQKLGDEHEQPFPLVKNKPPGPVPKYANGEAVWGQGPEGARQALKNLERNGLPAANGSRGNLEGWKQFYEQAQASGKGGQTAPLRAELIRRMLEMLARQGPK